MDKKTYLCRYHNILEKIEKKKRYIKFCQERASSPPGLDFTIPRVDHTPSNDAYFVRWVFKEIEAEEELEELEKKLETVKMEIERSINTVKDEELQMLLTYRYIDWLTCDEICVKIFCSIESVKRKHERAIEMVKILHIS
ncbi:DUF1492 domain-containing protein [bacterium]|nr:DUF1492 domain-containing protein [bacterium]